MKYSSIKLLSAFLLLLSISVVVFGSRSKDKETIRFYFNGHQDDWQLFMADQVVRDIGTAKTTVFVYTTAGDEGKEEKYWMARESGALASQRFVANIASVKDQTWSCATETVREHSIRRCAYGNTIAYFMRLPDGNCCDETRAGKGFTKYGNQSLQYLKEQNCEKPPCKISAVDNSTTYRNWEDFRLTIEEMIKTESRRIKAEHIWLNAQDFDRKLNPGDHSDHYHTGMAVREATDNLSNSTEFRKSLHNIWFVDYDILSRPPNLNSTQFMAKAGAFMEYDKTVAEIMQEPSTLCSLYNVYSNFLYRTYSRVE